MLRARLAAGRTSGPRRSTPSLSASIDLWTLKFQATDIQYRKQMIGEEADWLTLRLNGTSGEAIGTSTSCGEKEKWWLCKLELDHGLIQSIPSIAIRLA